MRWAITLLVAGTVPLLACTQEPAAPPTTEPEQLIIVDPPKTEERAEDRLETDRDSFTPATTTVAPGRLLLEASYSFLDNRRVPEKHSFPEVLVRIGLTRRIEARLGWNFEVGGGKESVSGGAGQEEEEIGALARESRMLYGVKILLTDPDGLVPRSSAILQGYTPTSGKATATQLSATYVAGWELPNRWNFDAAIRYETFSEEESGARFGLWSPSAVLRVPFGERWTGHVEYFGRAFENGRDTHYFSPGIHVLLTPDLEVGLRVGWGLNDESVRFFSNFGVGWRF